MALIISSEKKLQQKKQPRKTPNQKKVQAIMETFVVTHCFRNDFQVSKLNLIELLMLNADKLYLASLMHKKDGTDLTYDAISWRV